jgi:hypothetical protein
MMHQGLKHFTVVQTWCNVCFSVQGSLGRLSSCIVSLVCSFISYRKLIGYVSVYTKAYQSVSSVFLSIV